LARKTIFMVAESQYPDDPRVFREAQYLQRNHRIFLLVLKNGPRKALERSEGVTVLRIPNISKIGGLLQKIPFIGKLHYMVCYTYITLAAQLVYLVTWPIYRYGFIHAHNPPDTYFVLGAMGKVLGSKFVFDVHDLSPELYISRYPGRLGIIYKLLKTNEGWSCRMADMIITTNESYRDTLAARYEIEQGKIHIVRNDPDLDEYEMYDFSDTPKDHDRFILLFIGAVNPQDGLGTLLEIISALVSEHGRDDIMLIVVGDGDALPQCRDRVQELGIQDFVDFKGYIRERREIQKYLHMADICLEPAPSNPVNDLSTFVKIMEYMAARKPVVAFDLPESRKSADDTAILIPPGDIARFTEAILELLEDKALRDRLGDMGFERIRNELNWQKSILVLGEAYSSLT